MSGDAGCTSATWLAAWRGWSCPTLWSGSTRGLRKSWAGNSCSPRGSCRVVRVRAIFDLYLEHEALLPVVQELERQGWVNKRWTTGKGRERGGQPFV